MKKYNEKGEYVGEVEQKKFLETLNKDRRKAEKEFLEGQQRAIEIQRIKREGINEVEELVFYVVDVIESVKTSEDMARVNNNPLVYSEAIGIRREMEKLLNLVFKDGTALETIEGTEENHRVNNEGEEGYV